VRFIEHFARENGVLTLWLFTWSAEGLYGKLGWRAVERLAHNGREVVVMNKSLSGRESISPRPASNDDAPARYR
jgi:hypothetical protein